MTSTAVNWGLGAVLVTVASIAIGRLVREPARRATINQRTNSILHLIMAAGMAAMLISGSAWTGPVVATCFGAAGVVLLTRRRLHHAAMSGVMVLMALGERMPASPASLRAAPMHSAGMQMPMPVGGSSASPLLIAAFCYAFASACVFAWHAPALAPAIVSYRARGGRRACGFDPLGRACEVMMLVSTAVMLLPMI